MEPAGSTSRLRDVVVQGLRQAPVSLLVVWNELPERFDPPHEVVRIAKGFFRGLHDQVRSVESLRDSLPIPHDPRFQLADARRGFCHSILERTNSLSKNASRALCRFFACTLHEKPRPGEVDRGRRRLDAEDPGAKRERRRTARQHWGRYPRPLALSNGEATGGSR